MQDRDRQLTHVVIDLLTGRIRIPAGLAGVCGVNFGASECDVVSFSDVLSQRIPVSERACVDAARKAIGKGEAVGEGDLSITGDDGVLRRIECSWRVERDVDGEPTRVVVHAVDADAVRRTGDALDDLEARHRSALKAGRLGSWETDLVARTRRWSPEGMALFGLALPDGQGQVGGPEDEYLGAIHPDDRDVVTSYYALADEQDSFAAEYRILRPDGATVWLAGRGLVLSRSSQGKAQRLVSIMADVTDRRAVEEDLRMERERLILALGAGQMGAFDLDMDRDVLWWSPQMYEVFGVSPDTFVPTRESVARLVHPADFEEFARRRAEAIARRHPFEIEARVVRPDGAVVWVAHRGHATYDLAGRPRRSFGVTMDISERKAAEQALRDADRMKDAFIATLAHELRNPLAPIRNAVALLRQHSAADDVQGSKYRDVLSRQIAQMSRLLDDLLDVSRIGRGQVTLRPEAFDLRALFDQAVEVAQPAIEAGNHSLEIVLPEAPVEMVGDVLRLSQLLSNLLLNAAKYTPQQGHVRLSADREGDEIVLRVQDDGVGIAADQMAHIFEMFGQGDSAHDRSQGGLGIGLALARGLAELHGGRIEASSEGPGKGSTFAVRLPLVAATQAESVPAEVAELPPASADAGGIPLKILVADDLVDNADTFAELLQAMGHDVRVAHDGIEALRVAATFLPDAAILDLGMPGMTGIEVAREIRRRDWGATMVLICQTGWGQDEYRRKSRDAGFDHHLVKPVDLDELARLLHRG